MAPFLVCKTEDFKKDLSEKGFLLISPDLFFSFNYGANQSDYNLSILALVYILYLKFIKTTVFQYVFCFVLGHAH